MSAEPDVQVPMPTRYGSPPCPSCGYRCGCCCLCDCQTPCPAPDEDGDCDCDQQCHGGHQPWDCRSWRTRYAWTADYGWARPNHVATRTCKFS
jgi:hypothetical protein